MPIIIIKLKVKQLSWRKVIMVSPKIRVKSYALLSIAFKDADCQLMCYNIQQIFTFSKQTFEESLSLLFAALAVCVHTGCSAFPFSTPTITTPMSRLANAFDVLRDCTGK